MATYYFSGINCRKYIELLAREGAAGMALWKFISPGFVHAMARFPETKIVMDSGFEYKPTNKQYIELILRYGERFEWIGNNDVIGNQAASDKNYSAITSQLPKPLADKLLWIYQAGEMDYLKRHAAGRLIGVGGLVPIIKTNVAAAVDYIGGMGKSLASVGGQAHFFGVGTPDIILEFRNEPWFASADSQTWLGGFKARELIRSDGRRVSATEAGFMFEPEECAAQNIRTIHSWLNQNIQLSFEVTR